MPLKGLESDALNNSNQRLNPDTRPRQNCLSGRRTLTALARRTASDGLALAPKETRLVSAPAFYIWIVDRLRSMF